MFISELLIIFTHYRFRDTNIFVINCGSSSIKFQVINPTSKTVWLNGMVERLGSPGAKIKAKYPNKDGRIEKKEKEMDGKSFGANMSIAEQYLDTLKEILKLAEERYVSSINMME